MSEAKKPHALEPRREIDSLHIIACGNDNVHDDENLENVSAE
jgi:hypothetical protein